MTKPGLASVLLELHRLAEMAGDRHQTDRQLLERFQNRRDERAFAILVRRYGGLVLSACRRVLHEEADVEDAFQATFLVLLRRAASVRWRESIGNWLYGVAHRIAVRARARAAKRKRQEREASCADRCSKVEAADLSWHEAIALLHEELDRLPDRYRLPLLLCYLDGQTREEAAQALGCSIGSIKGRLERGRERLRQRLMRRGVALSGALLATLVDAVPGSSAPPPSLIQSTLQAIRTGGYGPSIAALLRAATPAAFTSKASLAAVLLLMFGLMAVSGRRALAPAVNSAPPPATAPAVKEPAGPESDRTVLVRGRVLDPDGKPVEGARLYASHLRKDPPIRATDFTFLQRGITDAGGRFRIEWPRSAFRPNGRPATLLAVADGYGSDWVEVPRDGLRGELTLRLVKDQEVRGRILTTEGNPLAGARVRVLMVLATADGKLDAYLNAWQREWQRAALQTPKRLDHAPGTAFPSVLTDREGRFRLGGVGRERVAVLQVQGTGIATTSLMVLTRPGFDPATIKPRGQGRPDPLFGPTFDCVAATDRVIEGSVREAGSGKPIPGFTLFTALGDNTEYAITDRQGRYRLAGIPRKKAYTLTAQPPEKSSWLGKSTLVTESESVRPLKVDFTVARGIVVTGQLLDKTSGWGVLGRVRFVPLADNSSVQKLGYDSSQFGDQKTSDGEGRFRLVVLPGPCLLLGKAGMVEQTSGGQRINPFKQAELDAADRSRVKLIRDGGGHRYFSAARGGLGELDDTNAAKYLNLAPDAAAVKCDLHLDRGKSITVKIEDDRGKPLPGTAVGGATDVFFPNVLTVPDAQATIYGLDPNRAGWLPFLHQKRRLIFLHAKRQLAGTLTASGDEKKPLLVRLTPTGSVVGRVLDREGQPRAGIDVEIIYADETARHMDRFLRRGAPIRTDKEGRFRLESVIPGLSFGIAFSEGRTPLASEPRRRAQQVKSGERLDLGELRTEPQR